MIGVTLRYRWITERCSWSRSGARSPIREAILPRSHSPSGDGERKGGASLSLYNASGRLMTAQFIIFYFKKTYAADRENFKKYTIDNACLLSSISGGF